MITACHLEDPLGLPDETPESPFLPPMQDTTLSEKTVPEQPDLSGVHPDKTSLAAPDSSSPGVHLAALQPPTSTFDEANRLNSAYVSLLANSFEQPPRPHSLLYLQKLIQGRPYEWNTAAILSILNPGQSKEILENTSVNHLHEVDKSPRDASHKTRALNAIFNLGNDRSPPSNMERYGVIPPGFQNTVISQGQVPQSEGFIASESFRHLDTHHRFHPLASPPTSPNEYIDLRHSHEELANAYRSDNPKQLNQDQHFNHFGSLETFDWDENGACCA